MIKELTLPGKYFTILIHIFHQQLYKVITIIIPIGWENCVREDVEPEFQYRFHALNKYVILPYLSKDILLLKEEGSGKILIYHCSYNYNPSINIMQTTYLNLNKALTAYYWKVFKF